MSGTSFAILIIGAGPAGLSAATHAASLGMHHVLLESTGELANTIQRYQKAKHVMAEPGYLPLRSPVRFTAGTRESILEAWQQDANGINVIFNAEVVSVTGSRGSFRILTRDGREFAADQVVLCMGLQGNPRKLNVPGEDLPCVQYQLDDPGEYSGESIVVVGAGDSAIENALGLAKQNQVCIVNRREDFYRAKEGNLNQIDAAILSGRIQGFFNTAVHSLQAPAPGQENQPQGRRGTLILNTPEGEVAVAVDRVIARLGAVPPRAFVESCGIVFPNAAANAVPEVSDRYESNVPGLYIVGALAGYPLIKQAMNQGRDVIEYALGRDVVPVDHELLARKFAVIDPHADVEAMLAVFRAGLPLMQLVNMLRFRDLVLESYVHRPAQGEVIFRRNDYTDTFFSIVHGEVEVVIDEQQDRRIRLGAGQFFGEMGLISGRRRSATVLAGADCVLIETPRRIMRRLIASVEAVKRSIDTAFILRAIHTQFAPASRVEDLAELVGTAELRRYDRGQTLFSEGDDGNELHLVRSGSLTVSRQLGGREVVLSYVPAGNYVGEMGLMGHARRSATVRAAVPTETVVLKSAPFLELLERDPEFAVQVRAQFSARLRANVDMESLPDSGDVLSFLMAQGLGEATDVLLIDESLCIRCDYCERACAGTHGGTSRLDREAGPTYADIHVPTSCRHCEHPHCMKDCPPDAISRKANGEVVIADNCIGCGNCVQNCPYGVIQLAYQGVEPQPLWRRLLLGDDAPARRAAHGGAHKLAVKCDMCEQLDGGPACVRACPTGAALRMSPERFVELVHRER